jgi:hypothetical protein
VKLWLVIYCIYQAVGVVGPLPYDMKECNLRVADIQKRIIKSKTVRTFGARDFQFACETHETAPKLSPYSEENWWINK